MITGEARAHPLRRYVPGRPLALAVVAVVASFASTLLLSHNAARSIDAEVTAIVVNAAPSIRYLSHGRADLRRQATYAGLDLDGDAASREASKVHMDEARKSFVHNWTTYDSLAKFPGEERMATVAREDIRSLFAVTDRFAARIATGDEAGARSTWAREMLPLVDQIDGILDRLTDHNADYARAHAQEIARVRRNAVTTAIALGAVSVLLAAAAAFLALEALRRHARVLAERDLLVEARADELEQFASRVAHDIKSPLGAVGLALQASQRGLGDPERQQGITARALSSLQRVQQIVDNLLAFAMAGARAEPGVATLLCAVISGVVDELRPAAEERGVTVVLRHVDRLWVACAPGTLASLVSNVLRNAIKFTAESELRRVEVRALDRGATARVEVEDTGPGIPLHLRTLIFEPYVRAPPSREPGIGLGLATVKRLVEAHGGTVGVESTVGKGSCFWFELPKASEPRPQPRVVEAEGGAGVPAADAAALAPPV